MKEFNKYQHIERLGTIETNGINIGTCFVFPKIDGTNSSVWNDDGEIACGSRRRKLSIEKDNQGFMAWVLEQDNLRKFIIQNPDIILYGEWLVPHTLKTYQEDAWRKFYVFDVKDDNDEYMKYEDYKLILDEYDIEYIPPICKIDNPTFDRLNELLVGNMYLIQDGKGDGEGIVIKNYDYVNKFGHKIWAKIVKNEFKAKHSKVSDVREIKECKLVESEIVDKYITEALIDKEYSKITNEMEGWSSKYIPRLLQTVYYCLVKEDAWNFVKEYKNPTIDFKTLYHYVVAKIKETKPNVF